MVTSSSNSYKKGCFTYITRYGLSFVIGEKWLSYFMLLFSFFISLVNFQNGVFVDEEDNLVMGSFILRGFLPYRDIFSHHFPFAYFWTSFVYLFSIDSIFLARFSIIIFQLLVFLVSMHLTGNYLLFGIVSLVWSLLRVYYRGNMVLYHSLAAPITFCVFLLTYSVLNSNSTYNWKYALVLAIFSTLLILLTPFTFYGLFFVYLYLFIRNRKLCFQSLIIMLMFLLLFFLYLLLTGSLVSFIDQTVLFNINIYSKYDPFLRDQTQGGLLSVFRTSYSLLNIGNKDWYNIDFYKPLTSDIDKWLFTGFHYRIAWLFLFLLCLFDKRYLTAFFSLFFGASLLSIGYYGFRSQPFVITSIGVSILIILSAIRRKKVLFLGDLLLYASSLALFFLMGWLCVRLIININNPIINTSYRDLYEGQIQIASKIKKWTCERKDVRLLFYPAGYIQHFFTRLLPLTQYTALYPWTSEIAQEEIIKSLQSEGGLVIAYIEQRDVWGIRIEEYMNPLIDYLRSQYKNIDDWVFVSPALYLACPVVVQDIESK